MRREMTYGHSPVGAGHGDDIYSIPWTARVPRSLKHNLERSLVAFDHAHRRALQLKQVRRTLADFAYTHIIASCDRDDFACGSNFAGHDRR